MNNRPRRPYETVSASHRGRSTPQSQRLKKKAQSSENTAERKNATAISESSLSCSTKNSSVGAPCNDDSKLTLGYGDNTELATNKLDSQTASCAISLSGNVGLYSNGSQWTEEDGKK